MIRFRHGRTEMQLGSSFRSDSAIPVLRPIQGPSQSQTIQVHRHGRRGGCVEVAQ
jgi:hypothetical protein